MDSIEKELKICLNCRASISTYPLDPAGTLYCDVIEAYVEPDGFCGAFKRIQDDRGE